MSGDIEEFLRRAAERRKQQGRGGRQGAPQSPPPRVAPVVPRRDEVIDAEIMDAIPVSGDDISREVAQHLDNREFVQRTSHLGESVRNEADNLQSHVQRDMGQRPQPLKERSANATDKATDLPATVTSGVENVAANELLGLLSSPQSLRQAVLLSEIFNRPENRW
jgi:hypothetical protein